MNERMSKSLQGHLYTSGLALAQVLLIEEPHKIFSYEEESGLL